MWKCKIRIKSRVCENRLCLESYFMRLSITNDSVVTCDGILEAKRNIAADFGDKKTTCIIDNYYFLLAFS